MRFSCIIILCVVFAAGCANHEAETPENPNHSIPTVSFVCAGDNLIHEQIWLYREKDADGRYNFESLYMPVKEIVSAADVAFVNQETVCGGETLGLSDWPRFNSPQEILDALAETGFNWISTANNHALDRGAEGIRTQLDYLSKMDGIAQTSAQGGNVEGVQAQPDYIPLIGGIVQTSAHDVNGEDNQVQPDYLSKMDGIVQTGTHSSLEDSETPRILVRNGIRVGIASYTYGTNGIAPPPGEKYLVDVIDETKIRADLSTLTEKSDIQIIAMHWGEEYSFVPTEEQKRLAQMLADSGADVVIGTHPHVIQTPEFLEGAKGNTTLVYYSLGNFISSQTEPDRMLGAMARFEIEYDAKTRNIRFLTAEALPLVTHISSDYHTFAVYPLADYTDELASNHALATKGLTLGSLSSRAREILGTFHP